MSFDLRTSIIKQNRIKSKNTLKEKELLCLCVREKKRVYVFVCFIEKRNDEKGCQELTISSQGWNL